jgi:hypothetical protein
MTRQKNIKSNSIADIVGRIAFKKLKPVTEPTYGEEGVDHINISIKSSTKLGRFLSNRFKTPFTHPEFGEFQSVEGLWCYLSYEIPSKGIEDRIRRLHFSNTTKFVNNLVKKKTDGFKNHIYETILSKMYTHPEMARELIANKLPLLMYYTNENGVRVNIGHGDWLIPMFVKIRNQLESVYGSEATGADEGIKPTNDTEPADSAESTDDCDLGHNTAVTDCEGHEDSISTQDHFDDTENVASDLLGSEDSQHDRLP